MDIFITDSVETGNTLLLFGISPNGTATSLVADNILHEVLLELDTKEVCTSVSLHSCLASILTSQNNDEASNILHIQLNLTYTLAQIVSSPLRIILQTLNRNCPNSLKYFAASIGIRSRTMPHTRREAMFLSITLPWGSFLQWTALHNILSIEQADLQLTECALVFSGLRFAAWNHVTNGEVTSSLTKSIAEFYVPVLSITPSSTILQDPTLKVMSLTTHIEGNKAKVAVSLSTMFSIANGVSNNLIEKNTPQDIIRLNSVIEIGAELLAFIYQSDPDIIISNGLFDHTAKAIQVLLPNGASRCKVLPPADRGIRRELKRKFAGRLLIDLYSSVSDVRKLPSYDLHTLAHEILDITKPSFTAQDESKIIISLISKLEILSITRSLTNTTEFSWQGNLFNQRMERNEMLVIHRLREQLLVIPSRVTRNNSTTYEGGLVLKPKTGLTPNITLCLDFNSLYPSIIREFNLCFTNIENEVPVYSKMNKVSLVDLLGIKSSNSQQPSTETTNDQNTQRCIGYYVHDPNRAESYSINIVSPILPSLVTTLIMKRKSVREQLSKNPGDRNLESKQLAYKLVANSLYGTIGFHASRFYCPELAARITEIGRVSLQFISEKANKMQGISVIYGDTDSIFIDTSTTDIKVALSLGLECKKKLNRHFQIMELDIDAVYRYIIFYTKKKYAGEKVVQSCVANAIKEINSNRPIIFRNIQTQRTRCLLDTGLEPFRNKKIVPLSDWTIAMDTDLETKGVDIVRNDWCLAAKEVGYSVINLIFEAIREDSHPAARIVEYLKAVAQKINGANDGAIPLDAFVVVKTLSKPVKEYQGNSHAHVNVVRRIQNEIVRNLEQCREILGSGTHIPFVVIKGQGSWAERARHPVELEKTWYPSRPTPPGVIPEEPIDINWYLNEQIYSVLARLSSGICDITEEDLKTSLGLPVIAKPKFQSALSNATPNGDIMIKFLENAETWTEPEILTRVSIQVNSLLSKYAKHEVKCSDEECSLSSIPIVCIPTRQCYIPNCEGELEDVYTATQLFSDLRLFRELLYAQQAKCEVQARAWVKATDLVLWILRYSSFNHINIKTSLSDIARK